jgi:hypothetical protein
MPELTANGKPDGGPVMIAITGVPCDGQVVVTGIRIWVRLAVSSSRVLTAAGAVPTGARTVACFRSSAGAAYGLRATSTASFGVNERKFMDGFL